MSELNRDEIIKGMEECMALLSAISLIKKLTKENEDLKAIAEGYQKQFEDCYTEKAKLTEEVESLKQAMEHEHASFMEIFGQYGEKCDRLTEENERLRTPTYMLREDGGVELIPTIKSIRADTVREFLDRAIDNGVCKEIEDSTERLFVSIEKLREIAKEMLEGADA